MYMYTSLTDTTSGSFSFHITSKFQTSIYNTQTDLGLLHHDMPHDLSKQFVSIMLLNSLMNFNRFRVSCECDA